MIVFLEVNESSPEVKNGKTLPLIPYKGKWYIKVEGSYIPEKMAWDIFVDGISYQLTPNDSDRVLQEINEEDRMSEREEQVLLIGSLVSPGNFSFMKKSGETEIVSVRPDQYVTLSNSKYSNYDGPITDAMIVHGIHYEDVKIWSVNVNGSYYQVKDKFIFNPMNIPKKGEPGYQETLIQREGDKVTITSTQTYIDKIDPDLERITYETGAQRSAAVEQYAYDLIHPFFLKRLAAALAEGKSKYGEHNWELGFGINVVLNHLLAHLYEWMGGDRSEDHLGHAAFNMMALVVEAELRYEENRKHLREPGYQLSPEIKQKIKEFQEKKAIELAKLKEDNSNRVEDETEQTGLTLLQLYQSGRLRYAAGCTIPFKILAREFFQHRSYVLLREELKSLGMHFDEEDNIKNMELR